MTDAERVAEYQRMMLARSRNKAARERALAGDPAARVTNLTNWQPMIDWLHEEDTDGREEADYGDILNLNPGVE